LSLCLKPAAAALIPPDASNLQAMAEAQMDLVAVLNILNGPVTSATFVGSVTPSEWTSTLSAEVGGQPLSYTWNGVYNLAGTVNPINDEITWSGSGTLGSGTLADSGTWTIIGDPVTTESGIVGTGLAAIGAIVIGGTQAGTFGIASAVALVGTLAVGGAVALNGTSEIKVNVTVGTGTGSGTTKVKGSDKTKAKKCKSPCVDVSSDLLYDGVFDNGQVSGTITSVPEPATLACIISGVVALLGFYRLRHR